MSGAPILLFDGLCNFCALSVKILIRFDRKKNVKVAALQSDVGQHLLKQYGFPTDSLKTAVLIHNDESFIKSAAALKTCTLMSYPWPLLYIFNYIPKTLRDWSYDFLIKYRYQLFGKADSCLIPKPEHTNRFATLEDLK